MKIESWTQWAWTTPLDRLPKEAFQNRLQEALAEDDGFITKEGAWRAIRALSHRSGWTEATQIGGMDFPSEEMFIVEVEVTKKNEIVDSGELSWIFLPCSQCGQKHARQQKIVGEMKCTDCVANNVRAASRKSSADYRERNRKPKEPIACAHCGQEFTPKRSTAQFCSVKCRVSANRAKAKLTKVP